MLKSSWPLGYVLSFGEGHAGDLPGNARLHLNAVYRLDVANCRDLQWNIFCDRIDRANRNRVSPGRVCFCRYASAGCHRKTR